MSFWVENDKLKALWITVFFAAILIFNFLNVRKLGEIEYWLALVKIEGIVILIILGILLVMGVSNGKRQLGTSPDNTTVIPCSPAALQAGQCLDTPGFACNIPHKLLKLIRRLG